MKKNLILTLIVFLFLVIQIPILKIKKEKFIEPKWNIIEKKDKTIGHLSIPMINLEEDLYDIESKENNIEKHVTILKETKDLEGIIFLAAHSGTGKIAYFEELDKLRREDEITLNYYGETNKYIVKDIWEEKKNGYININKEIEDQLILTTCSPTRKNYQLIISCIKKES